MSSRALTLIAACLLVPLSLTAPAAAQVDPAVEQEARSLFEAGRTAYENARYEPALDYFQRAYDLSQRPGLLFNIAAAADRLQRNERALEAYRAYLEAMPDAANRAAAERRIAFLEGLLAEREREVATPTEAAATVADPQQSAPPAEPAPSGGDVTSEWWFWTIIAVVAVGAGVGIGVGVAVSSGQVEAPLPGDFPATMALTRF